MKAPSFALAAAGAILYTFFALPSAPPARASPICTTLPQSKWISEARVRTRLARMGYRHIRAIHVSGSCYEIHAITHDGRRAELYLNPVTGAVVQNDVE